jgi:hypothetical protein
MEKIVKRLNKNKLFLSSLASSKPKTRKHYIQNANCKSISLICELADNVLYGYIPISIEDKNNLKKFKSLLEKLCLEYKCSNEKNLKYKKDLLGQSGGFLNILIPAVITGIASIISSFISKPTENNISKDN